MLETLDQAGLRDVVGKEVIASDGERVGYVDLIFADDAMGRAEWPGVWNGLAGSKRHLVPIRGVTMEDSTLRLPWLSDAVRSAPTYDEEDDRGLLTDDPDGIHISREKEEAAYGHYGVEPLTQPPAGVYVARFRAWRIDVA
jgi:hypothetical protein